MYVSIKSERIYKYVIKTLDPLLEIRYNRESERVFVYEATEKAEGNGIVRWCGWF